MMRTIVGTVLALSTLLAGVAQAQTEQVFYYHTDAIGSVRMITDETGQVVARYDYRPFGDPCGSACGAPSTPDKRQFVGKERDQETGFDYFGARYYASQAGRFTSPDPVSFQMEMLTDPQRFAPYAYARNNPLRYIDPKGEAIELLGDEEERRKALAALRSGVGQQAGTYLYETQRDKNGKYYVGIYSGGPDGQGPAFSNLNPVAAALSAVIQSKSVVTLGLVSNMTTLTDDQGSQITIGSISSGNSPGVTSFFNSGRLGVFILDPSTNPGVVPANMMNPSTRPGSVDQGILALHELGHAGSLMGVLPGGAIKAALDLENAVRRARNPSAPIRVVH